MKPTAQLAHGKSGPLGSAYDRAEYLAQRRHMMVVRADYLDKLRDGADVIPIGGAQSRRRTTIAPSTPP